jgi:hypothetical protein
MLAYGRATVRRRLRSPRAQSWLGPEIQQQNFGLGWARTSSDRGCSRHAYHCPKVMRPYGRRSIRSYLVALFSHHLHQVRE